MIEEKDYEQHSISSSSGRVCNRRSINIVGMLCYLTEEKRL